MGTAVHVDGWGGFLTAEHVVEFLRAGLPQRGLTGRGRHDLDPTSRDHAVVMLGIGAVFGQVAVPDWAFAPIGDTLAVTREVDDPLVLLQGRRRLEIALDIAGFRAALPSPGSEGHDAAEVLPLQLERWTPTVGEQVLAFGYPQLKPSADVSDESLQDLIEDGLFGAYGTVTELFREGRDRMNSTPAFEVAADWPSGMSGGPVVNSAGNVVGLVSRSLAPDSTSNGTGYAACLPWIDELRQLAPHIDRSNPGYRIGYAVVSGGHTCLASVWPSQQLAMLEAMRLGPAYGTVACKHRIGSDHYICI